MALTPAPAELILHRIVLRLSVAASQLICLPLIEKLPEDAVSGWLKFRLVSVVLVPTAASGTALVMSPTAPVETSRAAARKLLVSEPAPSWMACGGVAVECRLRKFLFPLASVPTEAVTFAPLVFMAEITSFRLCAAGSMVILTPLMVNDPAVGRVDK